MIVNIGNNEFIVKTMLTPEHTQKGMQGRKFDSSFNGMLFLMDTDEHNFWMKDCLVPLDIIFIRGKRLHKIHHNCQPCKGEPCEHYQGVGDLVLELPGGTCEKNHIKEGDFIKF